MRKVKISKLCMVSIAFVSLSMVSCMEKELYSPKNEEAPSLATFATTQDVQFAVQYNIPTGYASGFDVYTENPLIINEDGSTALRTDIEPIAAGITESGSFNMMKRLPGYVKELYIYSDDLFAPRLMHAKIENGNANFRLVSLPETAATSNMVNTRGTSNLTIDQDLLPTINDMHVPTSLLDGEMEVPYAVLNTISKTFPSAKTAPVQYIHDATLEVKENAELWVTPLITDCSIVNTLGYFCYNGDKALNQISINELDERMLVVFPWAKLGLNDAASGLKIGQRFKLKYYDKVAGKLVDTFPKGTKVIWFLYGGAYNQVTKQLGAPKNNRLYSVSAWNTQETEAVNYPHTTYFDIKYNNATYTCFGFEDQINKYSDRDFNDLVFMMQSNPSSAITPPEEIPGDDNTPKEKVETRKGILAFEDNWPWAGDYDLNDVVVKYNSVTTYVTIGTTGMTYVQKTTDTFTLLHSGASFHNSFSIKYDFAPSKITSITVNGKAVSPRADGDGFIVNVCPDVIGSGILTPYEYGQSYDYNIVMEFGAKEMSQNNFQKLVAPYNSYISPSAGIEVHLPMYEPTSEADKSYFHTRDDRSIPADKIFYVGKENSQYPWAIHLSGVDYFTVPTEKLSIDTSYPRFIDWVKSDFKDATDWYKK